MPDMKLTLNVDGKPVEFTVEEGKLNAYDLLAKRFLHVDRPSPVTTPCRCFEALGKSHLSMRGDQLIILPRGLGGAKGKQETQEIPEEYICPITHQLMYEPVMAADGETYEKEAIERHLQSSDNSPLHGDILAHKMLTPNRALKRTIETFRKKTVVADDELYLPSSLVEDCHKAVLAEDLNKVKTLVQKDPRLFQHKFEGEKTLLELSFQTTPATVKEILALYPPDQKPKRTHRLCASIAKALKWEGLKTLLEDYSDTTSLNIRLESAIAHQSVDYAKALLKLGANPNQADASGKPPLHQAIDNNNKALISILLQNGADAKQRNADNQTSIEYATICDKPHLANHIAFQKHQLKVRPHLTPLQRQVDQLMAMQLALLQTLEPVIAHLDAETCQAVKQDLTSLQQKLSTIVAAPTPRPKPKRAYASKPAQLATPENIRQSDLIELLNQHFQDLETLVRLYDEGDLKLGSSQEQTLILHYASAGLLMRIFHLLGIASNQHQLPQLFSDEQRSFERPTAYEYRGQLMHHLFKFRGCTLVLLNTAKALIPLSKAIQTLKNTGQSDIDIQELSALPIHKIARVIEGIEEAVKDQLRAGEDIDQYLCELSVLSCQAQALETKNPTLWQQAGLLHFAITTLSCALGQRLKDIANYPAYQAFKNKMLDKDPQAITTATIGNKQHTATLFEIDRLRFGHAYNDQNLAPGRADVERLRETTFALLTPGELTQRLQLATRLAPNRPGRQEPIPLFFQDTNSHFGFTQVQVEALSQSLQSLVGPSSSAPAVPEMAFGRAMWEKYFGIIGKEPPLPSNIEQILNSPCPIWPDKKVKDTHVLTLVPSHVDGKPLTLAHFLELTEKPKVKDYTTYKRSCRHWLHGNENACLNQSRWVLMTRETLPDTKGRDAHIAYSKLCKIAEESGYPYRVPLLIEAVTSIYMEYFKTGTPIYSDLPPTYTRCAEKGNRNPMYVGNFRKNLGLEISNCSSGAECYVGLGIVWPLTDEK